MVMQDAAVVTNDNLIKTKTGLSPVFFIYLVLKNDMITPNNPTTAIPMMINPIGIPPGLAAGSCAGNVGIVMGGGGV